MRACMHACINILIRSNLHAFSSGGVCLSSYSDDISITTPNLFNYFYYYSFTIIISFITIFIIYTYMFTDYPVYECESYEAILTTSLLLQFCYSYC